MSDKIDNLLNEMANRERARYISKDDTHSVRNNASINSKNKTKNKRRTPYGPDLNHRRPKYFKLMKKFENPMAALGYTDDEYREYLKTGKFPSKKEQN
jgi:hypothetical protein